MTYIGWDGREYEDADPDDCHDEPTDRYGRPMYLHEEALDDDDLAERNALGSFVADHPEYAHPIPSRADVSLANDLRYL